MDDHEEQAAQGFALYLEHSGQVACPGGRNSHAEWWMPKSGCPWCKAVV